MIWWGVLNVIFLSDDGGVCWMSFSYPMKEEVQIIFEWSKGGTSTPLVPHHRHPFEVIVHVLHGFMILSTKADHTHHHYHSSVPRGPLPPHLSSLPRAPFHLTFQLLTIFRKAAFECYSRQNWVLVFTILS